MCDNQAVCCVVKTVKKNAEEEEFVGARVKQLSGTKVFRYCVMLMAMVNCLSCKIMWILL